MKTLGISDFKSLVTDCLNNPGLYEGKSIILWNCSGEKFGIAWRAIKESCIKYNKDNVEHQAWYEYSDFCFWTDDYSEIKAFCDRDDMYGYKNHGILFNTGGFCFDDLGHWLSFINSHINEKGCISKDFVLIACAYAKAFDINENAFSENCLIYDLQPSIEEWAEWARNYYSPNVINPIREFIETKNPSISFDYWQKIMDSIEHEMFDEEYESLKDFSENELESAIRSTIAFEVPNFPYKAFWDFIQTNTVA